MSYPSLSIGLSSVICTPSLKGYCSEPKKWFWLQMLELPNLDIFMMALVVSYFQYSVRVRVEEGVSVIHPHIRRRVANLHCRPWRCSAPATPLDSTEPLDKGRKCLEVSLPVLLAIGNLEEPQKAHIFHTISNVLYCSANQCTSAAA